MRRYVHTRIPSARKFSPGETNTQGEEINSSDFRGRCLFGTRAVELTRDDPASDDSGEALHLSSHDNVFHHTYTLLCFNQVAIYTHICTALKTVNKQMMVKYETPEYS